MKQINLAGLLIIFQTTLLIGQNNQEEQNPIDLRLEKCLSININMTTVGMTSCAVIATEEWDKELNKFYKLLMDRLTDDEKGKLKESQRQWIIYRDKELNFSYAMYGNMQGTMWQNVAAGRKLEIVKQRAIELKVYFEVHKFE